MGNLVETDLSAQNTFTPAYNVGVGDMPMFLSSYGTWAGTITFQIKVSGDTEFRDLVDDTYTSNFSRKIEKIPINSDIRAGFKTSEYTEGTITIQITQ
jgi:hypothetical protein